jgi:hypothetical protein
MFISGKRKRYIINLNVLRAWINLQYNGEYALIPTKFIQLDVFKLGPERSVGAEGSNKGRRKWEAKKKHKGYRQGASMGQ